MLRKAILIILFTLTVVAVLTRTAETTERLRRLTNTPEQALNLNPILSDDGRFVVFESTSDLANLGGPDSFHLARANVTAEAVAYEVLAASRSAASTISADGNRIAFSSNENLCGQNADRNSEIYLFDGSGLQQITNTHPNTEFSRLSDGNFAPSISADGRWIAFTSNRLLTSSDRFELFVFDTLHGTTSQLMQSTHNLDLFNPKLSGDGSKVLFIAKHSSDEETGDLMLLDLTTKSTRVLVSQIDGLSITPGRAISRDGNRIVYSARTAPNETQVFLFDISESEPRQLTQLGSRNSDVNLNATISADGKRIAFATRRKVVNTSDGGVELYLLDLPTGITHQITNASSSATGEVLASLNFDGSAVAFSFPRVLSGNVSDPAFANNPEIYLASVDPRPEFGQATVANAASRDTKESRIAPDSIAVVFGHQLTLGTAQANLTNGTLPQSIKGTTVQMQGLTAHLFYASPEEVVFLVPPDLADGPANVVVTNSEGFPSKATATIARTAPGVFSNDGEAVILNADTQLPSPFDPTAGTLSVSVFATGVRNAAGVSVFVGGESLPVDRVLPATLPGLDEIHVRLPPTLRGAGKVNLSVKANEIDGNVAATVIGGSSLRDIMINEVLADPPDGFAGDANHDGTRDSSADEFIELVNSTVRDIDLSGYLLQTRSLSSTTDVVRHRFASRTILPAGTALVVFGGGTINQASFEGAQVMKASTGGLSLNNSGGAVILRDASNAIVTSITYGTAAGVPANANQSITRFPDVLGSFVLHQLASNMQAFSPGTRVDGTPFTPSPAVALIVVSPSTASLSPGAQLQFNAKAFGSDNNELADVIFNWTSNNESVVSINPAGVANAVSSGSAEIVALGRGIRSMPAAVAVATPTPTPGPTPTPSPSPTPSASPSPTPTPAPSPSPSAAKPPLVISEFRTRGASGASDEFVELYNNSDLPVNVAGLKIRGSSGSGTVATRLTINANTIIPARGHFLAVNSGGYGGSIPGDQSFTSGIANDGGFALTTPDDSVVDEVGMSSGSAFKEGTNLSPLSVDSNQSYERKPGGPAGSTQDTQDNSQDFQLVSPADPQNLLSNPTPGSAPSPSPTPLPSPSPTPSPTPSPSPSPSPTSGTVVVISQVFGGGGNSGAPLRNDFIEIFNAGTSEVNLAGWSVQYASATASTWSITPLTAAILEPGQYYLIQESSAGTNGAVLPGPDTSGSISLAATSGKVALVKSIDALSGACPVDSNIVDFVGYGSTANCFEGTAAAPAPSNTMAILRANNGCLDTAHNSVDFTLSAPAPRNTSSSLHVCSNASNSMFPIVEALWLMLRALTVT